MTGANCYSCGDGYAALNATCVPTNATGVIIITNFISSNVESALSLSTACQDPNCNICQTDGVTCDSCVGGFVEINTTCVSTNLTGALNTMNYGANNVSSDVQSALNLTTICQDPNCLLCDTDNVTCHYCEDDYLSINHTCVPIDLAGVLNTLNSGASNVSNLLLVALNLSSTCQDPNCRLCDTDNVTCHSCGQGFVSINNSCIAITIQGVVNTINSSISNVTSNVLGAVDVTQTCQDPNCQLCLTDGISCLECGDGFAVFNYSCIQASLVANNTAANNTAADNTAATAANNTAANNTAANNSAATGCQDIN
jgi:hypothetical protein